MNKWTLLCVQDREGKTKSFSGFSLDAVYVISSLSTHGATILSIPKIGYSVPIKLESYEYLRDYLILTTTDLVYIFEEYND